MKHPHPHRLPDDDVTRAEYDDGCYVERLTDGCWGYVAAGDERPAPTAPNSPEAIAKRDTLPLHEERGVFL